jgi:hypothetical protein
MACLLLVASIWLRSCKEKVGFLFLFFYCLNLIHFQSLSHKKHLELNLNIEKITTHTRKPKYVWKGGSWR